MNYLYIALLWAAYCALHSYLISTRFTIRMNNLLKRFYSLYKLAYVVLSTALLIPLINFTSQQDKQVIVHYGLSLTVARYLLIGCFCFIFLRTFSFDYDPLSFLGIRQLLGFGKTRETVPAESLKRSGLLGVIRHPMYFSLIVFIWCQTFRMADIIVNLVLTAYIFIGTRLEERKLVLEFGDAYVNYQQEVPMLIPFTRPKSK